MMFELANAPPQQAVVGKVMGVGYGGCNAVETIFRVFVIGGRYDV